MTNYLVKTPTYVQKLWPGAWFRLSGAEQALYLTFDDGPAPGVTAFVLEELEKYDAKASFFSLGQQAQHHPRLLREIVNKGHSLGNHTFSHLDGWLFSTDQYERDIQRTADLLGPLACQQPALFRPPYGRITPFQAYRLRNQYQLVFWEVMIGDFDEEASYQICLERFKRSVRPGSIVVLHDSVKTFNRLRQLLPAILQFSRQQNYQLLPLPC
jgi:peptidoglycan/xylan/chitin deacetylase (PgdA/CDA1 family)